MDIQDLMPKIVERMQTSGQQRPAIYADTSQGVESYQIFQFGGSGVGEDILFFSGRSAGQKHTSSELIEAVFVAEIWRARRDELRPDERPTDSPARVEGVVFLTAKGTPPFAQVERIYDIQRDENGKVTGLMYAYESKNVKSLQGLAFVAGWQSRTMPDEEVKRLQPQGIQAFLK
jgi:hypothetical protein